MLKLAIAVMPVLLSACLGDIPPDHTTAGTITTDDTARQEFDGNVYGIIDTLCAGCHQTRTDITQFVDPDPATAYDKIVGIPAVVGDFTPADAPILTKIAGGHNGISYSADQIGMITTWLEKEVSERAIPTSPTTPDPLLAVERTWSGCLALADFRSSNMAQVWGTMQTDDDSTCTSCHTSGGFGMVASDDESIFFDLITKHSGFMLQYFAPDTTDPQHPVMTVNMFSFTQVSQALAPHLEHPLFDPSPGMAALQVFFTDASERLAHNECEAPTLQD